MLPKISFLKSGGERIEIPNVEKNKDKSHDIIFAYLSEKYKNENNFSKKTFLKELIINKDLNISNENIKDLNFDFELIPIVVDQINTSLSKIIINNNIINGIIYFLSNQDVNYIDIYFKDFIFPDKIFDLGLYFIEIKEYTENFYTSFVYSNNKLSDGFIYCINESKIILNKDVFNKLYNPNNLNMLDEIIDFSQECPQYIFEFLRPYFLSYEFQSELEMKYSDFESKGFNNIVDITIVRKLFEYSSKYIRRVLNEYLYDNDTINKFCEAYKRFTINNIIINQKLYSVNKFLITPKIDQNKIKLTYEFKNNYLYHINIKSLII